MSKFMVFNKVSGHEFGVYEAESVDAAIAAMLIDAGSDENPSDDLDATEIA